VLGVWKRMLLASSCFRAGAALCAGRAVAPSVAGAQAAGSALAALRAAWASSGRHHPSFRPFSTATTTPLPTSSSSPSPPPLPPRPVVAPVPAPVWFNLDEGLRRGLAELGLAAPTEAQLAAIPALLAGRDVLLTAATGTGKTLAYLLPLVHRLKADESERGIVARPGRPRALILAPTRELALQIGAVSKRLSHTARFSAGILVGGRKETWQKEMFERPVDLLIATPGRLAQALENEWASLADVRYFVADEADTLLEDGPGGFGPDVRHLLEPLAKSSAKRESALRQIGEEASSAAAAEAQAMSAGDLQAVQVCLAGATLPPRAARAARSLFPNLVPVAAASTHRLPPALEQRFIRVGGEPDAKHRALLMALRPLLAPDYETPAGSEDGAGQKTRDEDADNDGGWGALDDSNRGARASSSSSSSSSGASSRVLVFCNTLPSARSTAHYLGEQGYRVASLHGGIPPKLRHDEYGLFQSGSCKVLVATDAAARGLDFPGLDVVVLFDFPLNSVEYIHRAGRAARAGRRGLCVSLVAKRDVVLATALQRAGTSNDDLSRLSSARADYSLDGSNARPGAAYAAGSSMTTPYRGGGTRRPTTSLVRRATASSAAAAATATEEGGPRAASGSLSGAAAGERLPPLPGRSSGFDRDRTQASAGWRAAAGAAAPAERGGRLYMFHPSGGGGGGGNPSSSSAGAPMRKPSVVIRGEDRASPSTRPSFGGGVVRRTYDRAGRLGGVGRVGEAEGKGPVRKRPSMAARFGPRTPPKKGKLAGMKKADKRR
jgi:superfamily II DNA/RNA helicase